MYVFPHISIMDAVHNSFNFTLCLTDGEFVFTYLLHQINRFYNYKYKLHYQRRSQDISMFGVGIYF